MKTIFEADIEDTTDQEAEEETSSHELDQESTTLSDESDKVSNQPDTTDFIVQPKKVDKDLLSLINIILPLFRNKLVCRSAHTPKRIQNIPDIKNRKSEMMIGFCKVTLDRYLVVAA